MEQSEKDAIINQLNKGPQTNRQQTQVVYASESNSNNKSLLRTAAIGLLIVTSLQIIHLIVSIFVGPGFAEQADKYLISAGAIAVQAIMAFGLLYGSGATHKLYALIAWIYISIGVISLATMAYWMPLVALTQGLSSSQNSAMLGQTSYPLYIFSIVFWIMGLFALRQAKSAIPENSTLPPSPDRSREEAMKKSD